MELYLNSHWTEQFGSTYIAEAIAWSETGNHATIYATGITTDEANAKLTGALYELELLPETPMVDPHLQDRLEEKLMETERSLKDSLEEKLLETEQRMQALATFRDSLLHYHRQFERKEGEG
jgi:hypothetical protein